ncbi:hypothetical protein MMC06_004332 [Schaereria dolodes]|nr:hypothetical protein [Schaereria dolodes]
MAAPQPNEPLPSTVTKKKRKAKLKPHSTKTPSSTTYTIRSLPYTYIHLNLLTTPPSASSTTVDALTARTYLTSALQQFLGMTGTAIPVDFLKIEGRDVWVRVPREDGKAVVEAVTGWVGGSEAAGVAWRVKGKGEWLGGIAKGDGMELFED